MNRFFNGRSMGLCLSLICASALSVAAQSVDGWRGPNHNGIYAEAGLLKTWPAAGPQLLWETLDAGKGFSSPVIAGDRLYITGLNENEDREMFTAYTLQGKKIYSIPFGLPWKQSYPDSRSTPTIFNGKAYLTSGMSEVVCINIADGKIDWKIDGVSTFGAKVGTWGTSSSLLLMNDKLIYCPGGEKTAMTALDPATGKTIWQSKPLNDISNYASPILINYKGKNQIVALSGLNVFGVDPDNGAIEWTFNDWGQNNIDKGWEKIAPNMPLYKDGKIFVSEGYDMGSFQLQLADDLKSVKLVWRNNEFDTHIGGYVLIDGYVYGSNSTDKGGGNWMSVNWQTGKAGYETAWTGGKSKGSIVYADGRLYCYDERRGFVGLVDPTPQAFTLISEFHITKGEGPYWAHPYIHAGVLYIRHGNALMAYKIK